MGQRIKNPWVVFPRGGNLVVHVKVIQILTGQWVPIVSEKSSKKREG